MKRFEIMGSVPARIDKESLKDYIDSGLNTYIMTEDYAALNSKEYLEGLKLIEKLGLDIYIRGYNSIKYFDDCKIDFYQFKNFKGLYVWDEPTRKNFEAIGNFFVPFMNEKYPDKLFQINLFPSYAESVLGTEKNEKGSAYYNYINDYADIVLAPMKNPKVLSIDHYPLRVTEERGAFMCAEWLSDLYIAKKAADRVGAYFACCIQVYDGDAGIRNIESDKDIRIQVYASLSMGVNSIEYYQYGTWRTLLGMVDSDMKKRKPYYFVKTVNKEIEKFIDELNTFTWKGFMFVKGSKETDENVWANVKDKVYNDCDWLTDIKTDYDLVIGLFENSKGKRGYTVVNFVEPSSDKTSNIKLTFKKDSSVAYQFLKSFHKGVYNKQPLMGLDFDYELEAGDGLFITEEW